MSTPSPNELLVVEGLDKAFTLHLHGEARLPVVSNVAFTVARGECAVLGGPSGVGKSSILKIVFGNYLAEGSHILPLLRRSCGRRWRIGRRRRPSLDRLWRRMRVESHAAHPNPLRKSGRGG